MAADKLNAQASGFGRPGPGVLPPNNWIWLNEGDRVRIRCRELPPVSATVDMVAADASIFWVWLDGGRGRIGIHEYDMVTVWLLSGGDLRHSVGD